ncbi:hypothetical protein C8R47DRAFT_1167239 [Mycena vitilis]|nr:hypothetical protein C8R47DRAFT_1167239 [Mycena vitilis]
MSLGPSSDSPGVDRGFVDSLPAWQPMGFRGQHGHVPYVFSTSSASCIELSSPHSRGPPPPDLCAVPGRGRVEIPFRCSSDSPNDEKLLGSPRRVFSPAHIKVEEGAAAEAATSLLASTNTASLVQTEESREVREVFSDSEFDESRRGDELGIVSDTPSEDSEPATNVDDGQSADKSVASNRCVSNGDIPIAMTFDMGSAQVRAASRSLSKSNGLDYMSVKLCSTHVKRIIR